MFGKYRASVRCSVVRAKIRGFEYPEVQGTNGGVNHSWRTVLECSEVCVQHVRMKGATAALAQTRKTPRPYGFATMIKFLPMHDIYRYRCTIFTEHWSETNVWPDIGFRSVLGKYRALVRILSFWMILFLSVWLEASHLMMTPEMCEPWYLSNVFLFAENPWSHQPSESSRKGMSLCLHFPSRYLTPCIHVLVLFTFCVPISLEALLSAIPRWQEC